MSWPNANLNVENRDRQPISDQRDVGDPSIDRRSLHFLLSPILLQGNMFRRKSQNHQEIDITAERDAKVKQLRDALAPLSGRSLKFCTDACLRRYLEARNWNLDKAQKMLECTLKWRSEYKPEEIRWHEVAHEGETGKVSKANFHDRKGRTVLIMRPGKQNTTSPEGNIRHLVYLMENAILNLPEGQEQMSWLIDFNGWSITTNISIKTSRDIIYILQNHYPERLAVVALYNPPKIFHAFWKVVKYFVDQKTFQKIQFVYPNDKESLELMKTFFDTENLPSEFGGKATLKYDHEEFSRLMAQDDVKTAKFWELDRGNGYETNGRVKSEGDIEPKSLTAPAS
ncbi:Sec14p-like phosphatidylinositol transfer family protein [Perilla frutescens var. hirtella]|nr:Sec14p-like phosphatidylinositol transfer family protein [Perilla frutescens var. hirtella]